MLCLDSICALAAEAELVVSLGDMLHQFIQFAIGNS
jgi:hypothetical protein